MRTVSIIGLLATVLVLAQAPDLIGDGLKALDEGRYDDAVALFTQAVAADDGDINAHFNLALTHSFQGNDSEAIPEYRRVLELEPGLYEAEINLGQTMLRAGDAPGSIPYLQSAVEQRPGDFRGHYYLGEALLESGGYAEAEAAYVRALELDPEATPAEFGLARAIARQGRRTEAEPHYRKAALIDGEYQSFLLELAQLYEDNGELADAARIFREFPNDPAAQERAGVLSLSIGDTDNAIEALEGAVAASPTDGNRMALAQAYLDKGDLLKAEPLAARLVADQTDDFRLRMFYGRILRDQRKLPEAVEQFRIATQIAPGDGQAWGELAAMLLLTEQYPEALYAFERNDALGAALPGHYFFRATAFDRLRMREEALTYYNRFLEISEGANPDQEFQARQRVRMLDR